MKISRLFGVSLLFPYALLGGCAVDAGADDADEAEVTEDALSASPSNAGYYLVTRRDFRRCAAPACGGVFVKRVNAPTTTCADGSKQAECYVSAISFPGMNLSDREEAELRAKVENGTALIKARQYKSKQNGTTYGTLKANEGWIGATGSAIDGTFLRVADNGLRCITAPCPSTTAYTLNSSDSHNVVNVGLANTIAPAEPALLERAQNALVTKEGVLVAGGVALPKCLPSAKCGPFVTVSEIFLPFAHTEGTACGGRGMKTCNPSQFCGYTEAAICGRADAAGSCSYKPEACTALFNPVCGCDGNTYSNTCAAANAGVSVSEKGACK